MSITIGKARHLLTIAAKMYAARYVEVRRQKPGAGNDELLRDWQRGKIKGWGPSSIPSQPVLQVGATSCRDYRWMGCDHERLSPSDPHAAAEIMVALDKLFMSEKGKKRGWLRGFVAAYIEGKPGGKAVAELELNLARTWTGDVEMPSETDAMAERLARATSKRESFNAYRREKRAIGA